MGASTAPRRKREMDGYRRLQTVTDPGDGRLPRRLGRKRERDRQGRSAVARASVIQQQRQPSLQQVPSLGEGRHPTVPSFQQCHPIDEGRHPTAAAIPPPSPTSAILSTDTEGRRRSDRGSIRLIRRPLLPTISFLLFVTTRGAAAVTSFDSPSSGSSSE